MTSGWFFKSTLNMIYICIFPTATTAIRIFSVSRYTRPGLSSCKKNSKMSSQDYFLQVRHSTCAQRHKDELFRQTLKYRYLEHNMSLYIEMKFDDSWISEKWSEYLHDDFPNARTT